MAKKSLLDMLIEESQRKGVQNSMKHYATFLKFREEICEAYREGWSYKEIWRVLERNGQIDFSYASFLNYTRKLKRRQIECEEENTRKTRKGAATKGTTVRPGVARGELPLFGQDVKPRDPKRF